MGQHANAIAAQGLAALQAATTVPARFMGHEDSFGSVAVGKVADMVLLDRNPLDSIANVGSVSSVVFNGRVLGAANLAAIKHRALASATALRAESGGAVPR